MEAPFVFARRNATALKRLASALIACGLPLLVIISVAIKLDSAGPVFCRSIRVGQDDRRFVAMQFRTTGPPQCGAGWLLRDRETTRVGRILRHIGFDSLPQLANVLRGEMTIVGTSMSRPDFLNGE